MTPLFLYGTLCHLPLLEVVLDRALEPLDIQPARLEGHAVFGVKGAAFPILLPSDAGRTEGLIVDGLTQTDLDRLDFYEGAFGYSLVQVDVVTGVGETRQAAVYRATSGDWVADGAWDVTVWAAEHGPITIRIAMEEMAHWQRLTPAELAHRVPQIRMRASSWLNARAAPADPERNIDRDVNVHRHHRPYMNFFAVEEIDVQYRRHDGTMSDVVNRGALMLGEAAVVLPYDAKRDEVLLVEQFRAPVYLGGSRAPWIWEPIAGLIDPGETPETCARREAMEEAGLSLQVLDPIGPAYSSTGSSNDFVHMFIGLADFTQQENQRGLVSEGEDIRTRILSFDDLMQAIDTQGFRDMPLFVTALWLARHRTRLRGLA